MFISNIDFLTFIVSGVCATRAEKQLLDHLFHPDHHDIDIRPVKDNQETLNVSLSFELYQLIQLVCMNIISA